MHGVKEMPRSLLLVSFLRFFSFFVYQSINQCIADLATGGNVQTRVNARKMDAETIRLMLTELVVAVEILHGANIRHRDLYLSNVLIDSDGHILLGDFGLSKRITCIEDSKKDWQSLANICDDLFLESTRDELQSDLIDLLRDMTDDRISGD